MVGVRGKEDVEGCEVDVAGFVGEPVSECEMEAAEDPLMTDVWRGRHVPRGAVDELPPFVLRPLKVVAVREMGVGFSQRLSHRLNISRAAGAGNGGGVRGVSDVRGGLEVRGVCAEEAMWGRLREIAAAKVRERMRQAALDERVIEDIALVETELQDVEEQL